MPLSPIEVVEQIVAAWKRDWEAAEWLCDLEIVAGYSRRLVDSVVATACAVPDLGTCSTIWARSVAATSDDGSARSPARREQR